MSTANNQSIQQINTAALRGTREAHQPDAVNEFIDWLKAWEQEFKDELTYCPESGKKERIKKLECISTALNLYEEFTEGGAAWPYKREAHQPDADLSKSITFRLDPFREDYEIRDGHGKCRGFIWRYAGKWMCRVDGDVRCCKTLSEAKELARALLLGN